MHDKAKIDAATQKILSTAGLSLDEEQAKDLATQLLDIETGLVKPVDEPNAEVLKAFLSNPDGMFFTIDRSLAAIPLGTNPSLLPAEAKIEVFEGDEPLDSTFAIVHFNFFQGAGLLGPKTEAFRAKSTLEARAKAEAAAKVDNDTVSLAIVVGSLGDKLLFRSLDFIDFVPDASPVAPAAADAQLVGDGVAKLTKAMETLNKSLEGMEKPGPAKAKPEMTDTFAKFVTFVKKDEGRQIVFGEVYVPDETDAHGDFMTADTIEKMAHAFLIKYKEDPAAGLDKQHDGVPREVFIVETFIARKGDPDFKEGAWVMAAKVVDAVIWKQVLDGTLTGFSFAGMAEAIQVGTGSGALAAAA